MTKFPRFSPGDPFGLRGPGGVVILDARAAKLLNDARAELLRLGNVSVRAPLRWTEGPEGRSIALDLPPAVWAKLSGASSPYSWVQQVFTPGSGWSDMTGGRTGTTNAYEANGVSGLSGKTYWLEYEPTSNDWRFQAVRLSNACPPGTAQICVTITDDGCGTPIGTHALITVKDHTGSTVGTCTTTGTVTSISLTSGGTGYTNGTGYTLGFTGGGGSGAAGTFDVVAGVIGNLHLTAGGTGYTTAPTLDFSAATGGSGVSATATIQERCCIAISSSGTYTVTADVPGATTLTTTIAATCSLTANNVSFSYTANSLGTACFSTRVCDNGNLPSAGATVAITGTGTFTGTTDSSGSLCVRLGVGSYSATITYVSGISTTTSFIVSACGTANITTTSVKTIYCSVGTDAPCGCTATVTLTRDDTGATIGTGSLTTAAGVVSACEGQVAISIPEVFLGTYTFTYSIVWPNTSSTAAHNPLVCTSTTSAFSLGFFSGFPHVC